MQWLNQRTEPKDRVTVHVFVLKIFGMVFWFSTLVYIYIYIYIYLFIFGCKNPQNPDIKIVCILSLHYFVFFQHTSKNKLYERNQIESNCDQILQFTKTFREKSTYLQA